MVIIDNKVIQSLTLLRNQRCLEAERLYNELYTEFKRDMDLYTLEQNAEYLDEMAHLKKRVESHKKWRDENKTLILAQYN